VCRGCCGASGAEFEKEGVAGPAPDVCTDARTSLLVREGGVGNACRGASSDEGCWFAPCGAVKRNKRALMRADSTMPGVRRPMIGATRRCRSPKCWASGGDSYKQ